MVEIRLYDLNRIRGNVLVYEATHCILLIESSYHFIYYNLLVYRPTGNYQSKPPMVLKVKHLEENLQLLNILIFYTFHGHLCHYLQCSLVDLIFSARTVCYTFVEMFFKPEYHMGRWVVDVAFFKSHNYPPLCN